MDELKNPSAAKTLVNKVNLNT